MQTNIQPSKAEMVSAWGQLKCSACGFPDETDFIAFVDSGGLHYDPILIQDGDKIEALIYFDEYDACLRTCHAHFITAIDIGKPLSVYRQSRRVISSIMKNGDIDILFAYIPAHMPKAVTIARVMGFKEFAVTPEYTALTLQLDLI